MIVYLRDTSIAAWLDAGPAGWAPDLILAAAVWIVVWVAVVKGAGLALDRNRAR